MNANLPLLEEDIDKAIANYEQQRKQNRRRSVNVSTINASMAAITTVLIGLSNIWQTTARVLSALAIASSALVGIISGWDRIYNHKKLWQIYTNSWIAMRLLKTDLSHLKKTDPENQEVINALYERYKKIVEDLNGQWNAMKITERE